MQTTQTPLAKVKIYDNGGKTFDRYTAVFTDRPEHEHLMFEALAFDAHPFAPQGFGQHCTARRGSHLGKRVAFSQLPPDAQKFINQNL